MPLSNAPSLTHAARHAVGAADAVSPSSIGALAKASNLADLPNKAAALGTLGGVAVAAVQDWRSALLRTFDPRRDLPNALAWYDASLSTGSSGASVSAVSDVSGNNNAVRQEIPAAQPTLNVAARNGLNTLTFAVTQWLMGSDGATAWNRTGSTQPFTFVAVCKLRAAGNSSTLYRVPIAMGTPGIAVFPTSVGVDPYPYCYAGGLAGAQGGFGVNDGQWHVLIGVMTSTYSTLMVDGRLVRGLATQGHGTAVIASGDTVVIGASTTGGAAGMDGDFAEGGVVGAALTLDQASQLTRALDAKWGLGLTPPPQQSVSVQDVPDANGQAVRVFHRPGLTGTPPLVIINHQQGGNWQLQAGNVSFEVAHELASEGYVVAVPDNHGVSSWTATQAVLDGPLAETAAATLLGLSGFSRIVLLGMSMGGSLAPIQAKNAAFSAPVKGVYLVDPACNVQAAYQNPSYTATVVVGFGIDDGIIDGTLAAVVSAGATSVSSTVSIPAGTAIEIDPTGTHPEIVTTTGAPTGAGPYAIPVPALAYAHASGVHLSTFPTVVLDGGYKHDPCSWVAGDVPNIRWRALASTADTSAVKTAHFDVFLPILTAATTQELSTHIHTGGHLSPDGFSPRDVVDFADRCG